MTLRQLFSFSSAILLGLSSVGVQAQKPALQMESAILLREDGTPRCRIGANPSEYLTAEKLGEFYRQAPGIDSVGLDALRECDKGDELYAISVLGSEDVHMAGVPSLVKWTMTALTGLLAFSIYKNYSTDLPSETLGDLSDEKSVGDHTTGERHKVPAWQWVDLIEPVMNSYSNGRSETDHCGIKMGGEVEVLHFTKDETQALVEYTSPGDDLGTPCPSGAKFFLNVSQLNTMNTEYENNIAYIEAVKKSVDLIISGEGLQSVGDFSAGDTFKVPGWQWVSPMLPIENQYRSVSLGNWQTPSSGFLGFGDSCGIKMGGEVRILGFTENEAQALVRYTFSGGTLGTPCPSGAIFFLNVSQLGTMNTEYENRIAVIEAIKNSAELIMSGEGLQSAGNLSTGDTFQVPQRQWVDDLRNLITNQYRSIVSLDGREVPSEDVLKYGKCGIKMGGEIRILGFTENESRALVQYTFSGNTSGTPCSDGAIFFLNVSQLNTMNTEYENNIADIEAIKESAELIMSGEGLQSAGGLSAGDTFQVPGWQWVNDLRNLITNQYRSIVSLDGREVPSEDVLKYGNCGIQTGGEVRILGFTEDETQALVQYTFSGDTRGTPCTDGAIFFLNVSQLSAME